MRGAAVEPVAVAIWLILVFSCPAGGYGEEALRVVCPPDGSALEGAEVEVIGLVPKGVTEVSLGVSGPTPGQTISTEHGAFAGKVRLGPGKARITVSTSAGDIVPVTVKVYLLSKGERVPAGYRRFNRHRGMTTIGECASCHKLTGRRVTYRRLRPVATCQDGDCHQGLGEKRFVHGPVGSGTCVHCHNPHGSFLAKQVSRSGKDLCVVCHSDAERFWEKPSMHPPVEEGDCTGCHDPHESDTQFQLLGSSPGDTCFNCHDRESKVGGKVTHDPVRQLECTLCHNPHADDYPFMLTAEKNLVCFSCHEGKEQEFAQKVQHKPVTEDCLQCHDVHTQDHPYMLFAAAEDLCLDCHQKATPSFVAELRQVTEPHRPVREKKCIACHVAHATPHRNLLRQEMPGLCFGCHSELGEQVMGAEFPHGPVEDGDCTACHQAHGSGNPRILNEYFPAEFYKPYEEDNYALCFQCHESDIASQELTTELTGFRNGPRNLHYLHVHRETKGRSCKACHELHGGPQEKHIRDEVPFGDMWSYPISFTRSDTGGSCVVGCHKPKEYDRLQPVQYD